MALFNLNLAKNYCSHWGIWEAVREILQNGEDQFTLNPSNEINVEYSEKNQRLSISNKESVLERRTLLLGIDDKADNDKLIGKFGEGYKIALLILTKLNKKVVIKNYKKNEKWTPELNKDPKYQNERVLKVNIKKYLFRGERDNTLTWEINGITPKEWKDINSKYLRYHELGKVFTNKKGAQILFEEKYRGCVFVNGLFIEKVKSNLAHGYNLTPEGIDLDRDRKTIEGVDFFYKTMDILTEYSLAHPEAIDGMVERLEAEEAFEDYKYLLDNTFYISSTGLDAFSDSFQKKFENSNKEPSFPVSNEKEKKEVRSYYPSAPISIVSKKAKAVLSKTKKYKDITSFMSIHNKSEKKKTLEPSEILKMFIDQHSSSIYNQDTINALEEIVKASEGWQNKPQNELVPIVQEDIVQEDVVEEKIIEEDKEKINQFDPSLLEFDDDIPF